MNKIMAGALVVLVGCFAMSSCAHAQGWRWFAEHVHRTGQCGGVREVAASFYNTGTRTADGEPFIHSALTAASRPNGGWPMGAHVAIRNPQTGRSVTVRINDAGPWGEAWSVGVRLDLSPAAFRALGMTQSGWVCAE